MGAPVCACTHCSSGLTTATIGKSSKYPIVFLGAALPRGPGFRKTRVSLPRKGVLQDWPHGHMAWRVTQGSTPGLVSIVKPGVWFSQDSGTCWACGRKIRVFGAREV